MKVLIVGLGSIARKHISSLRAINSEVEIYALRNSTAANENIEITNIFNFSEINNIVFDFCIISNPTAHHYNTIANLIQFNIPLFIEKPLFNTLDCNDILDKIKVNDIITYVACNLRFLDCINYSKEYLSSKRINEVNVYCGSYLPEWRPEKDFRSIYSANKELGGGVNMDLIHEFDYLFWLFGKPKKVFRYTSNGSSLNITASDYANYLLTYSGFNANVVLNYYRRDAKRSLEVICEDGTLYVDILSNEVNWDGVVIHKSDKTINDTYFDQLNFFLDKIITKETVFNDINEAFQVLEICIAKD
ncbi:MAG: Gfo/Idh/MocA family protein [Sphingobacteriaceae bacterium]